MLEKKIAELQSEIDTVISAVTSNELLEKFRIEFLSRSGKLASLYEDLKSVPNDQKPLFEQKINTLKKAVEGLFGVKVERVTTQNVLGKSKRTARGLGKRNDWKKAVISLQPGQELDFTSSAE